MGTVQDSSPLAAGTQLDGYVVAEVLEQGRFSFSYLAHDATGGEVVIKEFLPHEFAVREGGTVRPREADDRTPLRFWLRSFLDAAAILQKLNHPGLIRVLKYFEANGTGYYVTERVAGEPLSAILERQPMLNEAQLRRLLTPVLAGLEQAHAAGLLHRDIRPENVLVRTDDSAVLSGFGVLRAPIRFKTRTIFSAGTPPYAAPEEFYLAGQHGPWTDIYALGALAYRTVCGQTPPDARSRASGAAMTPAAQAARVRCSESLLAAVDEALQQQAEQRPQTIAVWRAHLQGQTEDVAQAAAEVLAALPPQRAARSGGGSRLPYVLVPVVLLAAAGAYFGLRSPSASTAAASSSRPASEAPAAAVAAAAPASSGVAAAPAAGGASADAGLDRLADEMMAKEKKAAEAREQLQTLQAQREQQAAQDAKNAKNAGAAAPAPAPAPSQAEVEAAARAKQLEQELQKLRAEKEAEEKARTTTVASAAPAAAAAPARNGPDWPAWYREATGQVKSNLKYPQSSLQAGEEGDITVRVRLQRDGSIVKVSAVQRSNYAALNNEALAVFSRIGRFPPVPADYSPNSSEVEFSMPINFKLND